MEKYLITPNNSFTKISELYHHGVKGMKWGVRRYQNKDGSLTDYGRKRYAQSIVKADRKKNAVGAAKNSEEVKSLYKSNLEILAAKKKLLETDKLGEEFFSDDNLQLKYKRIAAKAYNKKWGWGMTDEEIDNDKYWIWDDWDQGDGNSFECFLKDRGIEPKTYAKNILDAEKEYKAACGKAVKQMLGEYGDVPLRKTYIDRNVSMITEYALDSLVEDEMFKRNMYGKYNTY